jgi:hypothetical protein
VKAVGGHHQGDTDTVEVSHGRKVNTVTDHEPLNSLSEHDGQLRPDDQGLGDLGHSGHWVLFSLADGLRWSSGTGGPSAGDLAVTGGRPA